MLAPWMTRSPTPWERVDLSVSNIAALFLVKRPGGEPTLHCSESLAERRVGLNEPQRLDSVELLAGDRGVARLVESSAAISGIVVCEDTRQNGPRDTCACRAEK